MYVEGFFSVGLNICVGQENKEETDQRLDRVYVQDRRTGEGTDRMHDKSMGGEGTERDTRPGGDEWPGW